MLILGIDPGLRVTGYGLVAMESGRGGMQLMLREAGVLRMKQGKDLAERLGELYRGLSELLADLRPDRMAVEQLYAHYKHPRTAILMGHARGVILLAAAQCGRRDGAESERGESEVAGDSGIPITHIASTMVKRTVTGNGHASKVQVQRAVAMLCKLKNPPEPPDVADAIAIAWAVGTRMMRG